MDTLHHLNRGYHNPILHRNGKHRALRNSSKVTEPGTGGARFRCRALWTWSSVAQGQNENMEDLNSSLASKTVLQRHTYWNHSPEPLPIPRHAHLWDGKSQLYLGGKRMNTHSLGVGKNSSGAKTEPNTQHHIPLEHPTALLKRRLHKRAFLGHPVIVSQPCPLITP